MAGEETVTLVTVIKGTCSALLVCGNKKKKKILYKRQAVKTGRHRFGRVVQSHDDGRAGKQNMSQKTQ